MIPRIGYGYDLHRSKEGDGIRLGGVDLPAPFALEAHSDGDVLIHALIDSLLGALARGDIGSLFPDDDPKFQNASGKELLERTLPILNEEGYGIGNIDATVIAERPKLNPYIPSIRQSLSELLATPADRLSVKATTHEKLGPLGRGKGIATHVAALLYPMSPSSDQDV
jgi:2-C-methyl-D-erythritol 2,4-cyclodiphosphate synthase